MLTVRLSPELESRLNALAKKTHRSKSYYVSSALESFFADQEDYLEALSTLEDIRAGKDVPQTLGEVIQELEAKRGKH